MTELKVVSETSRAQFECKANALLCDGWKLHGEFSHKATQAQSSHNGYLQSHLVEVFCQVFIKETP